MNKTTHWTQLLRNAAAFFTSPNGGEKLDASELFAPAKTLGGNLSSEARLAMDTAIKNAGCYDMLDEFIDNLDVDGARGLAFLGYPALSMLEQNPLIRIVVETISREATRRWVDIKSGETENEDSANKIKDALKSYHVRELFQDCAMTTGFQGGCMLFIDTDEPDELLETKLILKPETFAVGKLKGFKKLEPINVTPAGYNASNPLSKDYFEPQFYFVGGVKVHKSRFLKFQSNSLNLLLRPAYNFFGISLSQIVLTYVRNFERARDANAKIVENFSLLGLKTDMQQMLQSESPDDILNRARMMLASARNWGLALVDKDSEEFFQINTPLSGLADLVSQMLELLALISGEPVTKLFGTPPKGFNATGESDMVNFYDRVKNYQEWLFYDNFEKVVNILSLNIFGEIKADIHIEWAPLKEPNEKETAEIQNMKAQRDLTLTQTGGIDAGDVRKRLSEDPFSDYTNIDPDDMPQPDSDGDDNGFI